MKDYEVKRDREMQAVDDKYKKLIENDWEMSYARRCLFLGCKEKLASGQEPTANNGWTTCDDCAAAAQPIRQSLICSKHSHITSYNEHKKTHAQPSKKRNEPEGGHDEEEKPKEAKRAKKDAK